MKVRAPGKVLLTGAYAVLDGAPAIVVAVDRYAVADGARRASAPPAEVRAAFGAERAPEVDVSDLTDGAGRKLGLGSSAAAVVAAVASRAWERGEDPRLPLVRTRIFRTARAAHARVQNGGSGVDVAASVHGGALRYSTSGEGASLSATDLPARLAMAVFFSGASARTSELRARVDRLRVRDPKAAVFAELRAQAERAADAFAVSARDFVASARAFGATLDALGRAADAPIVPPVFRDLAEAAAAEGAAFLPSGAGGGDVAVWLGTDLPPPSFSALANARSVKLVPCLIDRGGVRPDSPS
jgi:phosphomevalonate kinase